MNNEALPPHEKDISTRYVDKQFKYHIIPGLRQSAKQIKRSKGFQIVMTFSS